MIADIKSGRVTLRRRKQNVYKDLESNQDTGGSGSTPNITSNSSGNTSRRSQQTYSQMANQNPALREMYEILERMKRRNRQSKVLVELNLVPFEDSDQKESASEDGLVKTNMGSDEDRTDTTDGSRRWQARTVVTGVVDL